jgi:GNAT superfamily N-acetyltransferase
MSTQLIAVEFSASLLDLVREFSCGDEPHEQELADWIRLHALQAIDHDTRVWLYVTQEKQVVGYSSLGTSRWQYPDPTKKARATVAVIPAVAIQKSFWGQPPGPPENRYSSQILDHLILEAARLPLSAPVLGLFVHPANVRAIKFYERAGFQPFARTYTDPVTGITYRSMIRPLTMATS